MSSRQYCAYILTNYNNSVIYIGVTGNLKRRIWQHKNGIGSKFTSKYNVNKLVYCEIYDSPEEAIRREKQLKAGSRKKKVDLIMECNPDFNDLYGNILF